MVITKEVMCMKHNPVATANAAAATIAVVYVTCATAVALFPDFTMNVTRSWFHGIDLSKISSWNFSIESLVLGFATATAYGWFVGYVFATVYNTFAKK